MRVRFHPAAELAGNRLPFVPKTSQADLYPAEQRYRVAGRYALVNESPQPIASVYVAIRREARLDALSIPSARLAAKDDRFGMYRFDFQPPLAPGARSEGNRGGSSGTSRSRPRRHPVGRW